MLEGDAGRKCSDITHFLLVKERANWMHKDLYEGDEEKEEKKQEKKKKKQREEIMKKFLRKGTLFVEAPN